MSDSGDDAKLLHEKLDTITELLRHLLAIELAREGVKKAEIRHHLRVAKGTVVGMLKGIKTRE